MPKGHWNKRSLKPVKTETNAMHAYQVALKPKVVEDKNPTQLKPQEQGYVQYLAKVKEDQIITDEQAPIDESKAPQEASELVGDEQSHFLINFF